MSDKTVFPPIDRSLLGEMNNMIAIQKDSADYDDYMRGMYNGMVLMRSLVDGNDPEFLPADREVENE